MAIQSVSPQNDQSLIERQVGIANKTCIFPGIAQCFAVAGWTPSGMICTHVTPGETKDEMAKTFEHLKTMGGDTVKHWYVVGPTTDHFAVTKAQWRSLKDIKKTFGKTFKNSAATHWILDATAERHSEVQVDGCDHPFTCSSIDVRAEYRDWQDMIHFSWKEGRNSVKNWNHFALAKFKVF